MANDYSEYFTGTGSAANAFDGFTELGRSGHSRFGRVVRHGQIWFVKSYTLPDVAEAELRLRKEYELLLKLNHPGVVRAGWLLQVPGAGLCLAMEYIEGVTLDEFLTDATKTERRRLAESLLRTMSYVHSRSVCHLDLKPSNIMVKGRGNLIQPIIIDFGMADSSGNALFKCPGGTRSFGAPEQFGEGYTSSPRSDVYSLGKLLQMIDGGRDYRRAAGLCVKESPEARPTDAQAITDIVRRSARRRTAFISCLITSSIIAAIAALFLYPKDEAPHSAMAMETAEAPATSQQLAETVAKPEPEPQKQVSEQAATPKPYSNQADGAAEDEHDRLIREWQAEIDRRIPAMEKVTRRKDLTKERRREILMQMNDSLTEDTKNFFLPYYNRIPEEEARSKPMSWCSIYEPAFSTRRERMAAIYSRI